MENTAQLLEDSLFLVWNNRDAAARLAAMQKVYSVDIHFYEAHNAPAIIGYDAINEVISKLQSSWPPEFVFEAAAPAKANHQIQQAAWRLGVPGQPPVATGMDIAIVEDNRIISLHLFLDAEG